MKQQINFRASALTTKQLEWLMSKWGTSQTETLTIVIDRIFQQEKRTMNTEIKQGDIYTVNTTNDDQTQYVMQGAHDRYIGRLDVFAVNGDTATVHCRIEYFDDRNPKGTSNIVDRTFETPIAMIPAVGGHKWIKQ